MQIRHQRQKVRIFDNLFLTYFDFLIAGGDKEFNVDVRRCKKCLMPIKGHPLPRGENCTATSTLSDEEKAEIIKQKEAAKQDGSRTRKREERSTRTSDKIASDQEANKKRMASPANKEANKKRMASPANKEATKKRLASPAFKEANKKRMASPKNRLADKYRKKATFLRLKKTMSAKSYTGWMDPEDTEKPKIEALIIPKMDDRCVDCGALMFPFETRKKKEDGFSYSLCCEYGK